MLIGYWLLLIYARFQLATWSYFLAFFSIEKILCFEFYVSFQPLLYRNQKQQKKERTSVHQRR